MAKDVLITPAGGIVEFKDTDIQQASIFEQGGDLYIDANGGTIVLGDGTPANVEIGDAVTPVALTFMGGGTLDSNGSSLNIGTSGDVVNLNISGVTYNLPSYVVTTSDYTANDVLTKVKTVDGTGSGLDADLLDGNQASAFYLATNPSGYTTNTGTVTSVAATAGTGISISGSPITTSGTITVTNTAPNVTTNITTTHAASSVTVNSSDGTDGTINAATTSLAGVMTATDKTKLDGIAASANNYTLPAASTTVLGGIKLEDDTVQSTAANTVTTTASRTYGIQINSSGQAVVNVPWTTVNDGTLTLGVSGNGLSGTSSFTANQSGNSTFTVTSNATSANTASTIVFRDASSNFAANVITSNELVVGNTLHDYATLTTTATTQVAVASFAAATYGCGEFLIQATQGTDRHISKILVVHDSTTASATGYGVIKTGASLFTTEVDISGGNVRVLISPASATSTVFKTSYTLIGA